MSTNRRSVGTLIGAVLVIAGLGIIVLAFFNTPLELQLVLGLVGLCFIVLGFVPPVLARRRDRTEERHQELLAKLDELKEAVEAAKEEKRGGVAVADIINTGMKWYADYADRKKEEEEED